eukprot:7203677-Karenia_brevis.AAC.1
MRWTPPLQNAPIHVALTLDCISSGHNMLASLACPRWVRTAMPTPALVLLASVSAAAAMANVHFARLAWRSADCSASPCTLSSCSIHASADDPSK